MKKLEKLAIGTEISITKEEAMLLLPNDNSFKNLILGMEIDSEMCDYPIIQKATFSIEKTKRAGSIVLDYENWKCEKGQFVIRVKYDYMHPNNFCQSEYNMIQKFSYAE